ncbi:exodeoxyribonuclease V subunit beta [Alteromonas sediminis]|uniref:RecBCD enzyme subunit RecB n=1 Tax=Alteromonas sediminis TaxID=2259342 RepID=A0A3N5Y0B0_9ALTE|nr:exodeoxyribonuclease V subunit beta [Alteromonas sediminis]RPJ67077.1 exodeoxyribonuclease V subunit beta [Alteromonas sediminis]
MSHRQTQTLDPITLPLTGRQLIEASAGTGKTFNITRLYLRAILEYKLTVEQILVMTFSKAATEEIRGRVAQTLREALSYWQHRLKGAEASTGDDPVYAQLYANFPTEQARARIKSNLLLIDDAAIFTIHGFCQQMLSTYAYDTGNALNTSLNNNTRDTLLACTADWLRTQSAQTDNLRLLEQNKWHTPLRFLAKFEKAIRSPLHIKTLDLTQLADDKAIAFYDEGNALLPRREQLKGYIEEHYQTLHEGLTHHKDAKTQAQREDEWQYLIAWLNEAALSRPEKTISNLLNGNRYRGNESLKVAVKPIKAFSDEVKKVIADIEKSASKREELVAAFELATQGIKWIASRFKQVKDEQGWVEFDDLVAHLADTVEKNSSLADTLKHRFPLALVDEFQDTDRAQYALLAAIYPKANVQVTSEHTALLMIGDPKQAIYGFRGGDIFTYLAAAQEADACWVMDTNWRSTPQMVQAYNGLFCSVPFDFDMTYHEVNYANEAKANKTPMQDPDVSDALQLIWCDTEEENPSKEALRLQQSVWLATEIGRLLDDVRLGENPLQTRDIAVLVRTGADAKLVKDTLDTAGIASVYMSNQQSIYLTRQAQDCLRLLIGINTFQDPARLKAALVSPLLGLNSETLNRLFIEDDDQTWHRVISLVESLKAVWLRDGILAMLQRLIDKHLQLPKVQTERVLSNYQHLAELLQAQSSLMHLFEPQALIDWFSEQMESPPMNDESAVERLESDRDAIQIITQHKSKGLEYPVVFVPFANDYRDATRSGNSKSIVCQYYDPDISQLVLQVGDSHQALNKIKREAEAEAARLLYVAVTRAAHRCYLLCSDFSGAEQSTLGKAFAVDSKAWPEALRRFQCEHNYVALRHFKPLPAITRRKRASDQVQAPMCPPSAFNYQADNWRLLSYSALSHGQWTWRRARADEQSRVIAEDIEGDDEVIQARFRFPKGAAPGNVLHDIFEQHDFVSDVFSEQAKAAILSLCQVPSVEDVLIWLNQILDAPFTLNDQTLRLREIPRQKTLREAEFYFPLQNLDVSDLISWLQRFSLRQPEPAQVQTQLSGMMHGFIDLIFEHEGRYYVADYKSTFLGTRLEDYLSAALRQDMQQHQYDLQAAIYALALHRYLMRSLPNYDASTHFGGVVYFYLRGMHPDNQAGEGVIHLPVDCVLLQQLDAIFDAEVMS